MNVEMFGRGVLWGGGQLPPLMRVVEARGTVHGDGAAGGENLCRVVGIKWGVTKAYSGGFKDETECPLRVKKGHITPKNLVAGQNGVSYPGDLLGEKHSFPSLGVVASGFGDGIFGVKKGMLLADPQNPRHPNNVLRCELAVRMRRIKRF